MKLKIPILILFLICCVFVSFYGIKYNKYSEKEFSDTLIIQIEDIKEIRLSNYLGHERRTKDPEQIDLITNYFASLKYKRLRNDQTAYMPITNVRIIYIVSEDQTDFIVPYGKEAMISYKVYQIKYGTIEEDVLSKIYNTLPETGVTAN